jgi:hypothetical protein
MSPAATADRVSPEIRETLKSANQESCTGFLIQDLSTVSSVQS